MGCFVLAFDHCIQGYTNRNDIPRDIREAEPQVISQLFSIAAPTGSFGDPPQLPPRYSRVCLADPERAGKGE